MMKMMFNVGVDVQGNNGKVLECNPTVDAYAASTYTNTVSAFLVGSGGEERMQVRSLVTSKLLVVRVKIEIVVVLLAPLLVQHESRCKFLNPAYRNKYFCRREGGCCQG